jgi:16S rRNA processing protein RimM
MAAADAPLLEIGRITKPHGLQGEVLVNLSSTEASRLAPGSVLHAPDRDLVVIRSSRHHQRWIVQFEGVGSREAAEALQGLVLRAEAKDRADDQGSDGEDDALWAHELIGARVVDQGQVARGVVISVIDNPASDLLELDSGALVPLRFVIGGLEPGPDGSLLHVEAPDGLFDD